MGFLSVLNFAHKIITDHIGAGDITIDATVGNGYDTLFLLERVGPTGCVYGFDIQQQALEITSEKVIKFTSGKLGKHTPDKVSKITSGPSDSVTPATVQLFLQSHADMLQYIPIQHHGQVAAVMFNLGYCPGQSHDMVTKPVSTETALKASVILLKKGGVITVIVYTGHAGAPEEAVAVEHWAMQLPPLEYHVFKYHFINQVNHPSFLIAIEKR